MDAQTVPQRREKLRGRRAVARDVRRISDDTRAGDRDGSFWSELGQRNLGQRTARLTEAHDETERTHTVEALEQGRAAHAVVDDVNARAAGELSHSRRDVLALVEEDVVGACLESGLRFFFASHS